MDDVDGIVVDVVEVAGGATAAAAAAAVAPFPGKNSSQPLLLRRRLEVQR